MKEKVPINFDYKSQFSMDSESPSLARTNRDNNMLGSHPHTYEGTGMIANLRYWSTCVVTNTCTLTIALSAKEVTPLGWPASDTAHKRHRS